MTTSPSCASSRWWFDSVSLAKVEELPSVAAGDLPHVVVRNVVGGVGELLAAVGPVAVVVRIVAFPHQLLDADQVAHLDRSPVRDEACPEVAVLKLPRGPRPVGGGFSSPPPVIHDL